MSYYGKVFLKAFNFLSVFIICVIIANRGPIDNDYMNYYYFYVDSYGVFDVIFGDETLYRDSDQIYFFIISLFREFDVEFLTFLFLMTLLSIGLKYSAIRAYCTVDSSFLVLLLWLSFNLFLFEAMQTRFALAMGFLFYSFGIHNSYKKALVIVLGFGIHMGTLVLLPVFLFGRYRYNHSNVSRNLIFLCVIFLCFRTVDYTFLPRLFELIGNSTVSYLSGKLGGYLMQQDTSLSFITMVRFIMLVSIYAYASKYICQKNNTLYNYAYFSLLLLSASSGFSVFFARLLPIVEFLCFVILFKDVIPSINLKYKLNYVLGYAVLVFSIVNAALSLYVLVINGSFKL